MTAALATHAEAAREAAAGAGWTRSAMPAVVDYSPYGLVEVLPADLFARAGAELVVTYTPAGRVVHATLTRHLGGPAPERLSVAGPEVLPFTIDTLRSQR
jgi:hypothetical protein